MGEFEFAADTTRTISSLNADEYSTAVNLGPQSKAGSNGFGSGALGLPEVGQEAKYVSNFVAALAQSWLRCFVWNLGNECHGGSPSWGFGAEYSQSRAFTPQVLRGSPHIDFPLRSS